MTYTTPLSREEIEDARDVLQRSGIGYGGRISAVCDMALRTASAEADARRMDWLRKQATFGRYAFGDPPAWRWKLPHIIDTEHDGTDNARFNAAIDAAMDKP